MKPRRLRTAYSANCKCLARPALAIHERDRPGLRWIADIAFVARIPVGASDRAEHLLTLAVANSVDKPEQQHPS